MKVLLDARVRSGGVGRYAEDLTTGIARVAPKLSTFVLDQGESGQPFTPWGRASVARVARRERADLIHGLHFELPRSPRIPGVVTMPDLIPLDHPASMPSLFRRRYFAWLIHGSTRRAARVITVSRLSADALVRHGVPTSKIEIVPLGVGSGFSPGSDEERNAARNRFAAGAPYVAVVADDRPHKNLGLLDRLKAELPSGVVLICRGTSHRERAGMKWLPQLADEDLRLFYTGSDLLLVPSLIEGFGLPLLEAAACGTAVVCGKNIGALDHLDGPLVVDVRDAGAVARAVRRLLTQDEERADRSSRLRESAAALTLEAMAAATSDIYRSVAASN